MAEVGVAAWDPVLALLLDPAELSEVVGRDVRVTRLRPKPGVSHAASLLDAGSGELLGWVQALVGDARVKREKTVRLVAEHRPDVVLGEADLPELDALLLWGPVEADPRLVKRLAGIDVGSGTLLRYNPLRRVVLRLGDHVLRVSQSSHRDRLTEVSRALDEAGVPVTTPVSPSSVGLPGSRGTTVWRWVPGHDLSGRSTPEQLAGAGRLLAQLHAVPVDAVPELPRRGWAEVRAAAETSVAQVEQMAPEVAEPLRRAMDLLPSADGLSTSHELPADGLSSGDGLSTSPHELPSVQGIAAGPHVVLHGDFSLDQCLAGEEGLLLTDLDRAAVGPAEVDLASALAMALLEGVDLRPLVEAYAEAGGRVSAGPVAPRPSDRAPTVATGPDAPASVMPAAHWVAASLLTRASEPWRSQQPGWEERTAVLAGMALDLLDADPTSTAPPVAGPIGPYVAGPSEPYVAGPSEPYVAPPPSTAAPASPSGGPTSPSGGPTSPSGGPTSPSGGPTSPSAPLSHPDLAEMPAKVGLSAESGAESVPAGRPWLVPAVVEGAPVDGSAPASGSVPASGSAPASGSVPASGAGPAGLENEGAEGADKGAPDRVEVLRAWPDKVVDGVARVAVEGPDQHGRLRSGRVDWAGRVRLLPAGEDPRLPALAAVAAHGRLVVHRPGRRAVVALPDRFVKIVRPGRAAGIAELSRRGGELALAAGLGAAEVLHADDDTVSFSVLPGKPVHDLSAEPGWEDVWSLWAQAWTTLQATAAPDLPEHGPSEEAGVLHTWKGRAETAGVLDGTPWADRLAATAEELSVPVAERLVPTHRDLHDKQLLWDGTSLSVLDLDTASRAEPALDLANLAVHARLRHGQGLWTAEAAQVVLDAVARVADASGVGQDRMRLAERATVTRLVAVYAFRPPWRESVLRWAEEEWEQLGHEA